MANRSSFETQPVELLEHIFEHVSDQSDLLALSFASTILARVVIPRYLPVCCVDVRNIPLLRKLSLSPLRHEIHSLEIVSGADIAKILLYRTRRNPTLSLPDTEVIDNADVDATLPVFLRQMNSLPNTHVVENADVDGTIPALLREMTGLRAFHWNVTGIPPSTDTLAALYSRALPLECVKIHSLRPTGHNDVPDGWFLRDSPLWKLSNLTSFSYAVSSLTSTYNAALYVSQLLQMLAGCPMLEELELLLAHDRSSDMRGLFQGRWPQLKSLIVGGPEGFSVTVPLDSKFAVQSFFSAHPALKRLYLSINQKTPLARLWDDSPSPDESFAITSLLSLRLLHIPHDVFATIASTAYMPNLEHFRCFEAELSYLPRFRELTQHAPNITSIWFRLHRDLTLPGFKSFLACFPRLTKLYINNGPPSPWAPIVPMNDAYYDHGPYGMRDLVRGASVAFDGPTQDPLTEACDALSILPCLTHLPRFVVIHAHEALDAVVDPVVRRFAAVLPRLTYLEVVITGVLSSPVITQDVLVQGSNWLALRRDAAGVCAGWTVIADVETEAQRLELDYMSWGGLNWLS
ncbi:hypothetical protein DFH06DRAFT_625796 [Mycena polygramma]|nr:hypothetical protein DFH06DRAFT_625796 [Mycena polygramma]